MGFEVSIVMCVGMNKLEKGNNKVETKSE